MLFCCFSYVSSPQADLKEMDWFRAQSYPIEYKLQFLFKYVPQAFD